MIKRVQSVVSRNVQALRQRGSFAQNFAVAFSGTAAVAAIGFLVTPVMSRIYPPSSYGLFAVFNSIVANATLFSTLTYQNAFLLPRLRERFHALVHLSFGLSVLMLVVMSSAVALWRAPLLHLLNAEELGNWVYVVPATVFVYNLVMIMHAWYLRTKDFAKRAGTDVGTSLVGRGLTLGVGYMLHGSPTGLLLGDVFTKASSFLLLFFSGIHRQVREVASTFSWQRIRSVAHEYREYPFYVMPTAYLNTLASQLPILVLTSSFGTTAVGLYAFSTSLLELPINLIGNAIAPVFLQKANETYEQEPERLKQLCLDLYNKLFYLGLLPFGILSIFGDWIFKLAFGARWEQAGLFTAFLGYYYVFKLASYATGPIYAVFRKQGTVLLGTILLVLARAASLYIGTRQHDLNLGMLLFGISSLVVTFLIDMHILRLLKLPVWRVALRSIALVLLTLALLTGIRRVLSTDAVQQRWQVFYEQYWPK